MGFLVGLIWGGVILMALIRELDKLYGLDIGGQLMRVIEDKLYARQPSTSDL